MIFKLFSTFEFGYPHTLIQTDPARGAGPSVWNFSGMGHWKREQLKYHTSQG